MLLIGAASRNVGKTEFACEVIRQHASTGRVLGVKVTTVRSRELSCPRGGPGCGVCSSLTESYCIIEAHPADDEKDTTRMLRAGAQRVLWLRVLQDHLAAGLASLLDHIPRDACVVCESNSVRTVVEPGVFLVVREAGSTEVKPSCRAVLAHADRVVVFRGNGWDLEPNQVVLTRQGWVLRPAATAVILAGGESQRMGLDKSMLPVDGRPLIGHIADQLAFFPERLIGSSDAARYAFLQIPVVPDRQPGRGPLMGILACVDRAGHELSFVTGCDIPTLDAHFVLSLLARAQGADIVMPRLPDGRLEPLLAVYRKTVVPVAEAVLARGGRRIVELLDHLRVHYVSGEAPAWYRNLNTVEDYQEWLGARATDVATRP